VQDPDLVPFVPSGPPAATARRHGVVVRMWLSAPSVGQGEYVQALVRTTNTRTDPVWMWPGDCGDPGTVVRVDLSSVIRPGLPQDGQAAVYKRRAIRESGVRTGYFDRWEPRPGTADGTHVIVLAECTGVDFPAAWMKLRPGATMEERFVWYPARSMDVQDVRWQPLPPGTVPVATSWYYVGHGTRPRPGRERRPVHPIVATAALGLTGVDPGTPSMPELVDRALADPEFAAWVERWDERRDSWVDVGGWPGPTYPPQPRMSGLAGKAPNGIMEIGLQQRVPGVDYTLGVALVDPWTGEVVDVGFQ
jgi:hypothetical protein